MITEPDYEALVADIYAAVDRPLSLKDALVRVVRALGAAGSHLVGFDKKTREVVLSAISGLPLAGEIDYMERYGKIDPRFPACLAAPVGQLISCHEYLDEQFVLRSEFFQDFYIPYGCRYLTAVKLTETAQRVTILGVIGPLGKPPFGADALVLLRRVTPHFQRAMRLIEEHADLQNQWQITKSMLDGLSYAVSICDEKGQVLVANEAAVELFDAGDGLTIVDDFITAPGVAGERLKNLLRPERREAGNGDSGMRAVLVPRPSGRAAYQMILRKMPAERSALAFRDQWLWSVMISDPRAQRYRRLGQSLRSTT